MLNKSENADFDMLQWNTEGDAFPNTATELRI